MFYRTLTIVHWYGIIFLKPCKINCKSLKIRQVRRIITGDCYENAPSGWCCQNQTRLGHLTGKKRKTNGYFNDTNNEGNSFNYLRELFTISSNQIYQLRSNNHVLYLPKPNTNALKRSFSYKGAAAWNDIQLNKKLWIV